MHKIFVVIILIVASDVFCSQDLDSLKNAGLQQAYLFEFQNAEKTFNNVINKYPANPAGYFHLSQIYLWYYLGSKDQGDLRVFQKFTDIALEKTNIYLDKFGSKPVYLNIIGNLYMHMAMVAAVEEKTLDAFWATKKAYGFFEDAIELDENYSSAFLGLGLLEYSLSYVPSMFKWVISLSGLGSDKEKGYRLISKAYKYSFTQGAKVESSFHLGKIVAEYLGDYSKSVSILKELVQKYPNNLLFRYQLSLALIEKRDLNEAENNLQFIIKNKQPKFIQTVAYSYFLIGEIYFKRNEFKRAIEYYQYFLENSTGFDYSGIAYYNTALCYIVLGNTPEAKKNLLLARNGNTDIADDIYAAKRSEQIYNQLLNVNQQKILLANNRLQEGNYLEAEKLLETILESFSGEDKVKSLIILGECALMLKKYSLANSYFKQINTNSIKVEEWILPYFYYLKAELSYQLGKYDIAEDELKKGYSRNSYDFKDKIDAQLNFLSKKLTSKNQK